MGTPTTLDDARVTPPPLLSAHRRDIQGLRALAVLAVVAYHAHLPVPGGFTGVDVFFVISGFVITAMLMRERAGVGRIRFGRFYARRFKRLIPALALMVTVTLVLAAILLPPFGAQENTAKTAIGAMLICANAVIAHVTGGYFTPPASANPLLNTWSLSVEEQFYLVFPAVLALGWLLSRRTGGRRTGAVSSRGAGVPWAGIAVIAITVASFGLALLGSRGFTLPAEGWLVGFYSPLTRAWEFAVGALLALLGVRLARVPARVLPWLGWIGLALVAAGFWLIGGQTPFPGPMTLLPVLGTAALIVSCGAGPLGTVLSSSPAVRIGDWSYSIYLWHWPVITIACLLVPTVWWVAPLAAALSFLPAVASYHWVEQPIRTRPMPRPARAWPAAVGIIAVPVALAIGIGALAQRDTWVSAAVIPGLRDFSSSYQAHEGWRECLSTGTLDGAAGAMVPFGSCEWNATAAGAPIYLVGDSNAAQFTEAAIGAATSLGRPLVLDAAADCPVLAVEITGPTRTPAGDQRCHERNAALLEALASGAPGTVIIANTDMYTWKPAFRMGTTGADLSADPDVKVRAYAQGLGTVVDRLREAGHHVVIVQPVHRFEVAPNAWNPATCTILDFLATGCTAALPRADVDAQQAPIRAAIEQVRKQSGATIIDLHDLLCSAQSCPTQRDGMQLYVDSGHISVPLSQQAVDLFRTAVSS